jgi:hypothetical protein
MAEQIEARAVAVAFDPHGVAETLGGGPHRGHRAGGRVTFT